MQRHELDIRDRLQQRDVGAASAITTNSISTFFTPLAEGLLNSRRGVLAKVLPVTGCTGVGGIAERRFLAERFHVERIVTTHDPRRIAFSENTSIHECLLICRRRPRENQPPTEFVSLRRMPENAEEAAEAAVAIATDRLEGWGRGCRWPSDRMQAGDWRPVQWYDGALAEAARKLEENTALEPAGLRYDIGPDGRSVQDAYEIGDQDAHGAVPGFHSVSSLLRRTILGEPDVWYCPKSRPRKGRERTAEQFRQRRSHLLVPMRLDTISGSGDRTMVSQAIVRMVGTDCGGQRRPARKR